ncbi:uncharacterized protein DS421_17g585370 [Arachis hypogaea]|nr:uncharacterized protein DS421_17g585370 [Arachis hypogaea]
MRAEQWQKLSQNKGLSVTILAGWSRNENLRQARTSDEEGAVWWKHDDTEVAEAQNRHGRGCDGVKGASVGGTVAARRRQEVAMEFMIVTSKFEWWLRDGGEGSCDDGFEVVTAALKL